MWSNRDKLSLPVFTNMINRNGSFGFIFPPTTFSNDRHGGLSPEPTPRTASWARWGWDLPRGRAEASLRYSRGIFLTKIPTFPRLYQSIAQSHGRRHHHVSAGGPVLQSPDQRVGLAGMWAAPSVSDQNRRLTLYQGLKWQAVNQPGCTWILRLFLFYMSWHARCCRNLQCGRVWGGF